MGFFGKTNCANIFLEFSGGPDKALYLLSNLTRGREERPLHMKMTPRYGGDISCMQILKCFDAIAATLKKGGR